jgi:hypothetical protein
VDPGRGPLDAPLGPAHLVEETARLAGHADIRESIDGAICWTLMAEAEGWPEQDWT